MKRFLLFFSLVLVISVATAGYWGWQHYQSFLNTPIELTQPTNFEIKPGSNIRQVASQLQQQSILKQQANNPVEPKWLLIGHARYLEKATQIKAGEYTLEPGMLPDDLLNRFISGKTIQYKISLVEGRSFKDIRKTLQSHPNVVQTLSDADYEQIMSKLGMPESSPEGWFYPDTYNFPKETSDFDVLKRSHEAMKRYLDEAWKQRVPNPYLKTPYEALILASIVEKETGVADERPLIARVFLNRLEIDMMLQTDPTVIYGMGDGYDGNIRKRDLKKDTPYNTYTRKGLPPTPIATPGKAAIDAVFHPVDSDSLFFVATGKGDGRHYFSKTYAEHRRAVIKYQLNGKKSRYQGDK